MESAPNLKLPNTFSKRDIFLKVWTSPRAVFRYLEDNKYNKYVFVLLALPGISGLSAMQNDLFETWQLWQRIGFGMLIMGLGSIIFSSSYAFLLSLTGKLFRGKSNTLTLLRVIAYALIPSVVASFISAPLAYIAEVKQIPVYGIPIDDTNVSVLTIFSYALYFILSTWTSILTVIGISEVQHFSIAKTCLNIFVVLGLIILLCTFPVILFTTLLALQ